MPWSQGDGRWEASFLPAALLTFSSCPGLPLLPAEECWANRWCELTKMSCSGVYATWKWRTKVTVSSPWSIVVLFYISLMPRQSGKKQREPAVGIIRKLSDYLMNRLFRNTPKILKSQKKIKQFGSSLSSLSSHLGHTTQDALLQGVTKTRGENRQQHKYTCPGARLCCCFSLQLCRDVTAICSNWSSRAASILMGECKEGTLTKILMQGGCSLNPSGNLCLALHKTVH